MKVAIVGSPDFKETRFFALRMEYLLHRLPIHILIHGDRVSVDPKERSMAWSARRKWGTDALAEAWAASIGLKAIKETITKQAMAAAGSPNAALNRQILDAHSPQRVIAFPGGAEVTDMLDQARARGIKCIEVA